MTPISQRVQLGERSYDIVITGDDFAGLGDFARERTRGRLAFVVTDNNVASHAERANKVLLTAGFRTSQTVLPAGEPQKSLAVAAQLYDVLLSGGADRNTLMVAVGGGVIGDLTGFVASTYARGLPLLMVPTTLLAMVDSSVGGKVAVNHPSAKNLIGAFHQPVGVWIDVATLATLPGREYRSGLAEVVKYGVALDAPFFAFLEANIAAILRREGETVREIVRRSCRLKADVVEKDEREVTGLRAVLNYGHTFAHAVETAAAYGKWLHGEAVAAGMICAARLGQRLGYSEATLPERQETLLRHFGLPPSESLWPEPREMLDLMRNDKKSEAGRLRFVLPRRIGDVAVFDNVSEDEVLCVLTEYTPGN
jgi:3-dehydroquinate synthase